jgi:hypothetical protein
MDCLIVLLPLCRSSNILEGLGHEPANSGPRDDIKPAGWRARQKEEEKRARKDFIQPLAAPPTAGASDNRGEDFDEDGFPSQTRIKLPSSAIGGWRWLLLLRQAAFGGLCWLLLLRPVPRSY